MADLVRRLWAWLHTHEGKKIFRYSMVSVISTACSSLALLIFKGVIWTHATIGDGLLANGIATFPSYWLNRRWAWGKAGRSHVVKEVMPFWGISAAGIAFSVIGLALVHHYGPVSNHLEQTALLVVVNVVSFGTFWILKLILFNRIFHVPNLLTEIDEHIDAEGVAPGAGITSLVPPTTAAVRADNGHAGADGPAPSTAAHVAKST